MQVNIKLYELYCCCRCMVMVNAYRGHYGSSLIYYGQGGMIAHIGGIIFRV